MDPIISSEEKDIGLGETTRILVWSNIFGTLLKQHFGHIDAGLALVKMLDNAPPSYETIKKDHEKIIKKS